MSTAVRSVAWRLSVEGDQLAVTKLSSVGTAAKKAVEPVSPILQGISAASDELQGRLSGLAEEAGGVGTVLAAMGPLGLGLAAVLGTVGLAAHEAFSRTEEADEFADSLERIAQRLKLTTTQYQEISDAARQYNIEQGQVDSGLQNLSESISRYVAGLANGRGGFGQAFQQLGLSRQDLADATSFQQQIGMIANALSRIQNPTIQRGLAARLGVVDLLPLLDQGSDKIAQLGVQADAAGRIMDESLVKEGAAANLQFQNLDQTVSTRLKEAFVGLSPAILSIKSLWADILEIIGKVVNAFTPLENKSTSALQSQYNSALAAINHYGPIVDQANASGQNDSAAQRARAMLKQAQDQAALILTELGKRFGDNVGSYELTTQPKAALPPTQQEQSAEEARLKRDLEAANQMIDTQDQLYQKRVQFIDQLSVAQSKANQDELAAQDAQNAELLKGKAGYYQALLKQAQDASAAEIANIKASEQKQLDALDREADDYAKAGLTMPGYDAAEQQIKDTATAQINAVKNRLGTQEFDIGKQAQGAIKDLVDEINGPLLAATQRVGAQGLQTFTDDLVAMVTGAKSVSDAISDMVTSILADMARLVIEREITVPLVGALDSFLGGIFGGTTAAPTAGHASGGGVKGRVTTRINERGLPETFFTPGGDGYILSGASSINNIANLVSQRIQPGVVVAPQSPPKVEVHYHGDPMQVSQSYDAASGTTRIDLKKTLTDANNQAARRGDFDSAFRDRFGVQPVAKRRN